jgi:hypothetical protein
MENKYELKPRGYGEILDISFDIYKKNFLLLIGVAAIIYIPIAILGAILIGSIASANVPMMIITLVILYFAILILSVLANGAMVKVISERYLGNPITIMDAYKFVYSKLFDYILTSILAYILILAGFICLVIPGIIFCFWIAFIPQILILENISGWNNIMRGKNLIGGNAGRLIVFGVLYFIIVLIGSLIIGFIFGMVLPGAVHSKAFDHISNSIINIFALPLLTTIITILYYDIRIRKEGFDLEMLAASLRTEKKSEMI